MLHYLNESDGTVKYEGKAFKFSDNADERIAFIQSLLKAKPDDLLSLSLMAKMALGINHSRFIGMRVHRLLSRGFFSNHEIDNLIRSSERRVSRVCKSSKKKLTTLFNTEADIKKLKEVFGCKSENILDAVLGMIKEDWENTKLVN